ncbi:Mechanosensitive ion channel MscS [Plasmopara halstedii]|uniref:Mechanosensitive ion channel MscS n=1 Tax=Plasmopara halstedii TaxID=4781 RepID=A0A0P1ADM7_PLAHL|nr:Mechanosensitive ion channel MscS [Plasmopara halstedii]CEG39124.1 Mechanosensitive ion channel MscS [Plasmopara halstedii]|eukprot:XP_024575493.1 Mechanosensitive ion channel MscS [Plasmopara halstedii]
MSNSSLTNTSVVDDPVDIIVEGEASSSDQWRVFLGLTILVASYVLRVEIVRFSLRVARRILPAVFAWLREFEKMLLRPLSWVVFVLLGWFSAFVMDLENLLNMESGSLESIITLLLGPPLVWVVICFCNYVTWGIVRVQGWSRAVSKDDDDYNRVMIISEGIGVIKVLLVAAVVSTCIIDEVGQYTDFESGQVSTVAVIMVEFVFVFGAHSWLKNIMGGLMSLQDEQIKSGLHVSFQGHEGVVERLFLQGFSLRQYDKGLVYIPNSIMLENSVTVQSKNLDRRCVIPVHLSYSTPTTALRALIQELDNYLTQHMANYRTNMKSKVLGLEKPRGGWDMLHLYERSKQLASEETPSQGRFWISIEAPYLLHVVYYTHERHIRKILAEKTEIVLQITAIIAESKLSLFREQNSTRSRTSTHPSAVKSNEYDSSLSDKSTPLSGFHNHQRRRATQASAPIERRALSDGSLLRQRRPCELRGNQE